MATVSLLRPLLRPLSSAESETETSETSQLCGELRPLRPLSSAESETSELLCGERDLSERRASQSSPQRTWTPAAGNPIDEEEDMMKKKTQMQQMQQRMLEGVRRSFLLISAAHVFPS